jgi:hypothetical protein
VHISYLLNKRMRAVSFQNAVIVACREPLWIQQFQLYVAGAMVMISFLTQALYTELILLSTIIVIFACIAFVFMYL